jgi:hypothetical protein
MNPFIGLVYSLTVSSSLISAAEQARLQKQIDASARIAVGQTKAEVRAILGSPTGQWEKTGFLFASGPPQWAYGTWLDARLILSEGTLLPLAIPFNLRLFGPNDDDLVITWDTNGRVAEVKRP